MTHVFIVDSVTFDIHLKYMFAGTGTANEPLFLTDENNNMHHSREKNLISLIADISRIKINDKILFYVQGHDGYSGTFFGIFKAISDPFYCSDNYLKHDLKKVLQYRVLIQPYKVYQYGISEYIALDCLDNISHPSQMCWSLIYRKLRGNRGCTMITDYESKRLIHLIEKVNNNKYILNNIGESLVYNKRYNIISTTNYQYNYDGSCDKSLLIDRRLLSKMTNNNSYETHLQAYIIQHINENPLNSLLIPKYEKTFWLGNEVGCGVGMQKIDILIMQNTSGKLYINIIELKCKNPTIDIYEQLKKYILWILEYICPLYINKEVEITPIIIAPFYKKNKLSYKNINNRINRKNIKINNTRQIHLNNKLEFEELS